MPFSFKLIKVDSEWKIYDVNLGGIDLINTYKSNFKQILATGGVAKLADEFCLISSIESPSPPPLAAFGLVTANEEKISLAVVGTWLE